MKTFYAVNLNNKYSGLSRWALYIKNKQGGMRLNGDSADFSYVNMGDPYITTILHDEGSGKFRLMSWGDFIKEVEREN